MRVFTVARPLAHTGTKRTLSDPPGLRDTLTFTIRDLLLVSCNSTCIMGCSIILSRLEIRMLSQYVKFSMLIPRSRAFSGSACLSAKRKNKCQESVYKQLYSLVELLVFKSRLLLWSPNYCTYAMYLLFGLLYLSVLFWPTDGRTDYDWYFVVAVNLFSFVFCLFVFKWCLLMDYLY